ncbi:MAG: hypothetical protein FJ144_09875 [Deltaproteobacteria bacterium]|nr:hypothetical protein [Deltaproteobacteria bacterium]
MKSRLGVVAALSLATIALRCGGGDICLNCDAVPSPTVGPINTVTVVGTVSNAGVVLPSDIIVIACVGLPAQQTDFNDCPSSSVGQVGSNNTFSIANVTPGALRVGFWAPRNVPATRIEPGDPFAELIGSPIELLANVAQNQTVTISSAMVNFNNMTAQATIAVARTPTPTPAPTSTASL